jgi:hypothetical protein
MVHHSSHGCSPGLPDIGDSFREDVKASPRATLVVGPPTCFWVDRNSTTVFHLRTLAIMAFKPLGLEQWRWYDSTHVE